MTGERKELGKIQGIEFGMGGYQKVMAGFKFKLGGAGWAAMDFWRVCAISSDRMVKVLEAAKKQDISKLVGTPVEVTFHKFNELKSWRVLTEVL